MSALNATAQRAFKGSCGHDIAEGARCLAYFVRATRWEAMHSGRGRSKRHLCADCAALRSADPTVDSRQPRTPKKRFATTHS